MQEPYLEITFRHGQPMAAYYYFPRQPNQRSSRTKRIDPGMIVDFDEDGTPIGIEITAPSALTIEDFNRALAELGQNPVDPDEFAPLRAA